MKDLSPFLLISTQECLEKKCTCPWGEETLTSWNAVSGVSINTQNLEGLPLSGTTCEMAGFGPFWLPEGRSRRTRFIPSQCGPSFVISCEQTLGQNIHRSPKKKIRILHNTSMSILIWEGENYLFFFQGHSLATGIFSTTNQ